jgi:hypothetical protein
MIQYLPWIVMFVGLALGFLADRIALLKHDCADSGDYWASIVKTFALISAPLALSSYCKPLINHVWVSGYHLYFDLLPNAFDLSIDVRYWLALSIPFVYWIVLLMVRLIQRPVQNGSGRWIAGALGYSGSRKWLLFFTIPLLLILFMRYDALGHGQAAYPAALWGAIAALTISLILLSFTTAPPATTCPRQPQPETASPSRSRTSWQESMASQGIELQSGIAVWEANQKAREVSGVYCAFLKNELERYGAINIAPELIEAIARAINQSTDADRHLLIYCPDNCGETETVAIASRIMNQRHQTCTLVITNKNTEELAKQFQRWLPNSRKAIGVRQFHDISKDSPLWVVDAETLSDQVLPQLKNSKLIARIGLIVWWHLETFTGALAANLWAISRRLDRLIQAKGRHDARTFSIVRRASYSDDQLSLFLSRLLPYPFTSDGEIYIQSRFAHPTQLHSLTSHEKHFNQPQNHLIAERDRQLLLVVGKLSVEADWRTCVELPETVTERGLLQAHIRNGGALREKLALDCGDSEVRLMTLDSANLLSLSEMISQGGRRLTTDEHHVAITPPDNPYARFLIASLSQKTPHLSDGFGYSRRLVGAEPHPEAIRRHLIMALNELSDTRSNLLNAFLLEKPIVFETLDKIYDEGKLRSQPVRYLNQSGLLEIERQYTSQKLPSIVRQPLNTVGLSDQLIVVRDPSKGGAVQMRVDPERLTIQAYPHKIFIDNGQRYRIREWHLKDVLKNRYCECLPESNYYVNTHRICDNIAVFRIKPIGQIGDMSYREKTLTRVKAQLIYEETISGAFLSRQNLTNSKTTETTKSGFPPITQEFQTKGVLLGFPNQQDWLALTSLCQTLRHVLPVHLGVEPDAVEVVPIEGATIEHVQFYGVAIVDLYPQGIGLTDAIHGDDEFIRQLLQCAYNWLKRCPCQHEQGCSECLNTVSARAYSSDDPLQTPKRSKALALLE